MKIKWLSKALKALESEYEFIFRDNPIAAEKVVQRIHEAVSNLENNPSLGRVGRVIGPLCQHSCRLS